MQKEQKCSLMSTAATHVRASGNELLTATKNSNIEYLLQNIFDKDSTRTLIIKVKKAKLNKLPNTNQQQRIFNNDN
jgi:hypothetical protein